MSQQDIRSQVIVELQAGHLGMAMKLVEDNAIRIDDELRNEAVEACMDSLKRHFHWIIPAFVQAFRIKDNPRLIELAAKIVRLSLRHGQPLIAALAAQTFGIQLDESNRAAVESAKADIIRSMQQVTGAIIVQEDSGEYNLDLNDEDKMPEGMVLVPAGEFVMGTSDEEYVEIPRVFPCDQPQRKVYLEAFFIDLHAVTNEKFAEFVRATGYSAEGTKYGTWRQYAQPGKENHPVVSVSWNDIMAYCRWVGKRLPTEGEWEKASRGMDGRIWPWGNTWDSSRCNSRESKIGGTTIVDRYPQGKSPYGCCDMVGNVWELVADWLSLDYYSWAPSRNPKGPPNGVTRVMRGGAFSTRPECCRCAFRIGPDSSTQFDRVGFRCAKSLG